MEKECAEAESSLCLLKLQHKQEYVRYQNLFQSAINNDQSKERNNYEDVYSEKLFLQQTELVNILKNIMHEKVLLIKELITVKNEKNTEIFELKNGQNILVEQLNKEVLHYQNKIKNIDIDNSNLNKDITDKLKFELGIEKEKNRLFVQEFKKRQIDHEDSLRSDEINKKENIDQDNWNPHHEPAEICSEGDEIATTYSNINIKGSELKHVKTKQHPDDKNTHISSFINKHDDSFVDLIQMVGDTKLELELQKNENEKLQLLYKDLEAYTCTLKLQVALQESEKDDIKAMKNHINKILQNSMR
jgi:hypothetical protein